MSRICRNIFYIERCVPFRMAQRLIAMAMHSSSAIVAGDFINWPTQFVDLSSRRCSRRAKVLQIVPNLNGEQMFNRIRFHLSTPITLLGTQQDGSWRYLWFVHSMRCFASNILLHPRSVFGLGFGMNVLGGVKMQ